MTSAIIITVVAIVLAVVLALVLVRTGRRARPGPEPSPVPRPAPSRREALGSRVRALFGSAAEGEDVWTRLEDLLIKADVGPGTASRIVGDLQERFERGSDPEALLLEEIAQLLGTDGSLDLPSDRLGVVMMVGVNGSGKTTTIGKLAARLAAQGRRVTVAASDTFRAAASEQLDVWARRTGAQFVSQQRGADPGAVAFDAVRSASARGADVLIVDTAGRLHTRIPLMDELRKVRRVLEKAAGTPPDEVLLVLDATTGQNGIAQAAAFTAAVDVTGVALTKLDGTAKGGIVLAVRDQLGVPVKLVGTGEDVGDLEAFDPVAFARRILES
ncbi:MAG TPA: signal recognition particle-docking protein FtsY [Actinomycetota bacterium]|nr:signal recognition particle-docking protein FtsY [Actinomycetota bacterium]